MEGLKGDFTRNQFHGRPGEGWYLAWRKPNTRDLKVLVERLTFHSNFLVDGQVKSFGLDHLGGPGLGQGLTLRISISKFRWTFSGHLGG